MHNIKLMRLVILCGCLFEGLLIGCSSRTDPDSAIARVNTTNIQRLANLYFTFQSQHEWRGPADEAEFKSFLHQYNPHKLSRIGVDPNALDKLFISEGDSQPFKSVTVSSAAPWAPPRQSSLNPQGMANVASSAS